LLHYRLFYLPAAPEGKMLSVEAEGKAFVRRKKNHGEEKL